MTLRTLDDVRTLLGQLALLERVEYRPR